MITARTIEDFVAQFGAIYEHSPWIVRAVWSKAPFADADSLIAVTSHVIREAGISKQKALVKAHPELARKFGVDSDLGTLSAHEQETAGLDQLSPEEFETFRALNEAYRVRFDMPFVICVRKANKAFIKCEIERRLGQSPERELSEALDQIDQIALLRLKDMIGS